MPRASVHCLWSALSSYRTLSFVQPNRAAILVGSRNTLESSHPAHANKLITSHTTRWAFVLQYSATNAPVPPPHHISDAMMHPLKTSYQRFQLCKGNKAVAGGAFQNVHTTYSQSASQACLVCSAKPPHTRRIQRPAQQHTSATPLLARRLGELLRRVTERAAFVHRPVSRAKTQPCGHNPQAMICCPPPRETQPHAKCPHTSWWWWRQLGQPLNDVGLVLLYGARWMCCAFGPSSLAHSPRRSFTQLATYHALCERTAGLLTGSLDSCVARRCYAPTTCPVAPHRWGWPCHAASSSRQL